jgi:GT2 family glycosyltransferase
LSHPHADKEKPAISVVIITFNSHSEISTCLASLHSALASCKAQIIIIDNASSDGTIAVLERQFLSLQKKCPNTTLIKNARNIGYTAAINQGLRLCQGRFILLLNPDIILYAHTLSTLLDRFQDDELGCVAPQLLNADGSVQPSCRRFPRVRDIFLELLPSIITSFAFSSWKMPEFDHKTTREVDQPQGAFLLFRSSVLQQVGLLDERFFMFFSDVDFCRRIRAQGWRILFCAEAKALHFKGRSVQQNKLDMIISSHRSFVDYLIKYQKGILPKIGIKIAQIYLLIITLPRLVLEKIKNS